MTNARRRTHLAAVLATTLLAACAGNEKPVTRLYVLSPLPAHTTPVASSEPPVTLDVAALRLPHYLQRPQIVTRTAGNQLVLAEYHQWGGNLAEDMMRVLARNLSRLLSTPDVTVFSRRPPRAADARLEVDVLEFERGPDRRVRLSAKWRLRPGAEGAQMITRVSELESPPVVEAANMDETVATMSALLGGLSNVIARAIAEARR